MEIIMIPTINDQKEDFINLFSIYDICLKRNHKEILLDFTECSFLRQNAVEFIGGLIKLANTKNIKMKIDESTIKERIKVNLIQNGFGEIFFSDHKAPWKGNSIPYQEFTNNDYHSIQPYLDEAWLGRGWINIQNELKDDIVTRIFELFANSLEHSKSSIGCFSCGQNYSYQKELALSLVDFGTGIPQTVTNYLEDKNLDTLDAMRWAVTEGNSTRKRDNTTYRGGMGLALVQDFLTINGGCMDIYSNDCLYSITGGNVEFVRIEKSFEGTFINVKFITDNSFYTY